ncbi:MAG: M48 family metallopeptidase, partial [Gammaproteobacteria bacterium]
MTQDLVTTDDAALPLAWTLRRSARARRLALRVHHDGRVEVVAPRGVGEAMIGHFVDRHLEWILHRLAERPAPPAPQAFPPATLELPALGEGYRIHLAGGRGRVQVRRLGDGLLSIVGHAGGGAAEAERAAIKRALLAWLLEHAQTAFEPRLRDLAVRGGFSYRSLQLRRQRTRWGSCSSRGVISLNVCGVFQSPAVLNYLMIHELVHTRHMNHSAASFLSFSSPFPSFLFLSLSLLLFFLPFPSFLFSSPFLLSSFLSLPP